MKTVERIACVKIFSGTSLVVVMSMIVVFLMGYAACGGTVS